MQLTIRGLTNPDAAKAGKGDAGNADKPAQTMPPQMLKKGINNFKNPAVTIPKRASASLWAPKARWTMN